MPTINDSVQFLKGVGPAFAKKFEKLGILTIRDLLLCYPRKYIDYTQPYTVVSAPYDVECCVRATVLQKEPARRVKGGRVMNRVLAADDSGILALSWFNAPYAADKLEVGETYYFEGRIGGALTRRELLHPLVRTEAQVADCPFVAVYPGTDGLPASRHASCAHAALAFADQLVDPLPPELLTRYRMPAKAQAVRGIHAPKNADDLAAARRLPQEYNIVALLLDGDTVVVHAVYGALQLGQLVIVGGEQGLGPQLLGVGAVFQHRPGNGHAVKGGGAPTDLV